MHRPLTVSEPACFPVELDEVKDHLRVDHSDEDILLEGLIRAANDYLDGWSGVLGRCLVERTLKQEFDGFARNLPLPLGPVISVTSVTYRNASGQVATVASSNYDVRTDATGQTFVRFDEDYSFPTALHESRAVAVTYRAGYSGSIPYSLKVAILLLIGHWYENREAIASPKGELPFAVSALIEPHRRVGL